jgi:aspartyl-tRNA(Asn)/glutamyl-tRNA(Gln) amidotransferase subunit C
MYCYLALNLIEYIKRKNHNMKLTPDQVQKVSKLANLPITQEQESVYADQLSAILEYVDQLESVDVSTVDPIYNVSLNINITQEDKVSTSFAQDESLQNSSRIADGFFVTKGVFEES